MVYDIFAEYKCIGWNCRYLAYIFTSFSVLAYTEEPSKEYFDTAQYEFKVLLLIHEIIFLIQTCSLLLPDRCCLFLSSLAWANPLLALPLLILFSGPLVWAPIGFLHQRKNIFKLYFGFQFWLWEKSYYTNGVSIRD